MTIALAPAAAPLTFSLTINVNAAPYFQEWYADNKLPGELPGDFLVRQIGPNVVDYHAAKSLSAANATLQASRQSIAAEVQTIKATL